MHHSSYFRAMRIALIHYRLLQKGGLETRLFNYLQYFCEQGHDVHLIVSKIDSAIVLPSTVTIHQINLKRVPKPIRMWFFNTGLKKVMQHHKFDLSLSLGRTSHQTLVLCPGTHLGYMRALKMRIKGPIDWMNVYLDKMAYRHSKLILAASEKIKDELVDFAKVPSDKIRVLYPPTDTTVFNQSGKEDRPKWRSKYGFSPTKKSLLFITTGNHLKGYGFLLKLMAQLQDEPIELIIAGVKPIRSSLPNVKYLGYAEHVNELMWAADALIHPAIYEAYAQVVSEALLCGLPVIISDKVGAKSVVTKEVGTVVTGFEKTAWATEIKRVLSRQWHVHPDFAIKHQLSVKQHCEAILRYGNQANAER